MQPGRRMRATIEVKKHFADGLGVGRRLGAKIDRQQFCQPRRAVPHKLFEIVPHRMEAALAGPHIDRLMRDVFGKPFQAGPLQLFLQLANVGVRHRMRREAGFVGKRFHQHRRAQHLVVTEVVRPLRAQDNQGVGQNRQRFAGLALEAVVEPFGARVVERSEPKDVVDRHHGSWRLRSSLLEIELTMRSISSLGSGGRHRAAFHSCSVSSTRRASTWWRRKYPQSRVAALSRWPSSTPAAISARHSLGGAAWLLPLVRSAILASNQSGASAIALALSTLHA